MEFTKGKKIMVVLNATVDLVEDEGPMVRVKTDTGETLWVSEQDCYDEAVILNEEEDDGEPELDF